MKILKQLAKVFAGVAFTILAFRMIRVWQERARAEVRGSEVKRNVHYANDHFEELVKAEVIKIAQAESNKIEALWKERFGVKED